MVSLDYFDTYAGALFLFFDIFSTQIGWVKNIESITDIFWIRVQHNLQIRICLLF